MSAEGRIDSEMIQVSVGVKPCLPSWTSHWEGGSQPDPKKIEVGR